MPVFLFAALAATPLLIKSMNDELEDTFNLAMKATAITAVAYFVWVNRSSIAKAIK